MPLGIYRVEKTRVSLMEWELMGGLGLMVIMGALKTMLHDQCHVTPHGKLHGQIWECQETP